MTPLLTHLDDGPELARGYVSVRSEADVAFLDAAMRVLGLMPKGWRDLEERPRGIGAWIVEVAYVRPASSDDPPRSGVVAATVRYELTEPSGD